MVIMQHTIIYCRLRKRPMASPGVGGGRHATCATIADGRKAEGFDCDRPRYRYGSAPADVLAAGGDVAQRQAGQRASRCASWARTSRSIAARAAAPISSPDAAPIGGPCCTPAGCRARRSAACITAGNTPAPANARRRRPKVPAAAARIKIAGYPVHEYCGLIFAYMGEALPPAFDLPRKEAFEKAGLIVFRAHPGLAVQLVPDDRELARCGPCQLRPSRRQGRAVRRGRHRGHSQARLFGDRCRHPAGRDALDHQCPHQRLGLPEQQSHRDARAAPRTSPWVHRGVWNVPVDDTHTYKVGVYAIPSSGARGGSRHGRAFREVWRLQSR